LSNDSNAPLTVLYIRGNVTIAVAKTAEYHVIVILNPHSAITREPTGPNGPIVFSKKNPTTVGGSTMGSVSAQSRTPFINRGVLDM
jgi:hypothetical protein